MLETYTVVLEVPPGMHPFEVERALQMVPVPFGIEVISLRRAHPDQGVQLGVGNTQVNHFT